MTNEMFAGLWLIYVAVLLFGFAFGFIVGTTLMKRSVIRKIESAFGPSEEETQRN